MGIEALGWLVLAFPLAGTLIIALGWRALPGRLPGWIGTAAIFLSFLAAIGATVDLLDHGEEERQLTDSLWTYAATADFNVDLAILVDPLSLFMCLVVTGVSFLIHLYSVAYMGGDRGYARYFSYLNLFVFSMLLLVLAANFVILIIGWAFVGAASYLLISYWYRRDTAVRAGIKGFVINVIGDVGLVIAAFLILDNVGSLDFLPVFKSAGEQFGRNDGTLVAACLLLLVGAFAKSAQLPLHTWLPDAMEGPTPVSALIHAATVAPVVTDLKRIIAYSTISQIGYMVLGVSVAAYGAGLFHLMTHAFFKALLFMGAGSVIGAMAGAQTMDKMGGFRRAMPFTFGCMVVGYVAAFLTAVYTFRMIFRVFLGDPVPEARELEQGHLAHAEVHVNPTDGEVEDTDVGFPGPEHYVAERAV